MKCLVVIAHPLQNSLCKYLADKTIDHLKKQGYQVTIKDLYIEGFNPVLSSSERESYYLDQFDDSLVTSDIEQLKQAESLVLIFPTWWFGFPAILKGWFDRVWAPGHAYEHASDFGPIKQYLKLLYWALAQLTVNLRCCLYTTAKNSLKRKLISLLAGSKQAFKEPSKITAIIFMCNERAAEIIFCNNSATFLIPRNT